MPFNARRAKQATPILGSQGERGIDVESAIGHRALQALHILGAKIRQMRPPIDDFGARLTTDHQICGETLQTDNRWIHSSSSGFMP